jgi:hypothetical protein
MTCTSCCTAGSGDAFVELGWQPFRHCPYASPLHTLFYSLDAPVDGQERPASSCASKIGVDYGQFGAISLQ